MTITTAVIKELRDRTGAGMMDCKRALVQVDGNVELAIEELRRRGTAVAEKKAGRITAEGAIVSACNDSFCVLVEVNCETDFVAKDESFRLFSAQVAKAVLDHNPADVSDLLSIRLDDASSVEQTRQKHIIKISENLSIRRFIKIATDDRHVSSYLHNSRIGVLVKLSGGSKELGKNIAMHIAASKPLCIAEQDIDTDVLNKERKIYLAQAAKSGKSAAIIKKIVDGKVKRFLKENTLLDQPYVRDTDQTVGKLLKTEGVTVMQMVRYEVGEGLAKRSDDFVTEVMAQAAGQQ